jgi:hypothetical protein
MRLGITWFAAAIMIFLASMGFVSASNTNVTFNAGPFNGSIDLGMNCSDVTVARPIHSELPDGTGYDRFDVNICGVSILLTHYNRSVFNMDKGVSTQSIFGDLISLSADTKTIQLYDRVIDGQDGAAGSATVPRFNSDVYDASYLISPRSVCRITVWGASNSNMMKSALDTIHVREKA